MDIEFQNRLSHRLAPFDGVTLSSPECIPLSGLCKALQIIVTRLQAWHPRERLLRLSDWHEHDGILTTARLSSWEEIHALLASEATLYAASEGDTYVRSAFFPEQRDFILRIYVPQDYDNPFLWDGVPNPVRCGEWDVTCAESFANQLTEALQKEAIYHLDKQAAKEYLEERYGG